ncbi:SRPBCC family protein [Nocardiopsis lambiniae]|uniref:SRPBCC family protein n=1 Tax=Nocardiopsis lambiniae TaxID=3075539 RepID=A0ABU2M9G4_9ACTN|nr:SRPBCC family protein [Nocardiopsis sp. DSM 44743]MDT0328596.1 SRPBCC family protein [Nocardiopsis sp. DSM 44743]
MRISSACVVHAPVERSWEVFTDVESLVPCVPGVRLVGTDGERHLAEARIKVGPAVVACSGTVRLVEKDEEARRIVVEASGRARRGEGTAEAVVTAALRAHGDDTVVSVETELTLTGGLTRWNRSVIGEVADGLMDRCARRVEKRVVRDEAVSAPPGGDAAPDGPGVWAQRSWSAAAFLVVAAGMVLGYLLFG